MIEIIIKKWGVQGKNKKKVKKSKPNRNVRTEKYES